MLKLTEEVRRFVKKPFGRVYEGNGVEVVKRALDDVNDSFFVCVGDIVSYYALKSGLKPSIVVFDGRSVRQKLNSSIVDDILTLTDGYESLTAKNPAGCITEDLVEKIYTAISLVFNGEKVRVFVLGEEDLSVMPLVALLPRGSVLLYGQPGVGVVRVDVGVEKKVIIFKLLEKMQGFGKTLEKLRRWADGDSG